MPGHQEKNTPERDASPGGAPSFEQLVSMLELEHVAHTALLLASPVTEAMREHRDLFPDCQVCRVIARAKRRPS